MAKYNLELETTTHIKGMQVDNYQPDNGGGVDGRTPTS